MAMLFETRSKVLNLLEAEDQSLRVLQRGLQVGRCRRYRMSRDDSNRCLIKDGHQKP